MFESKPISRLAVVLGAVLLAGGAQAADRKWYAGSTCLAQLGSVGSVAYWGGTILNSHDSFESTLVCPLVRDGSSIVSGTIRVFDRHPTRDVKCWLYFEKWSEVDGLYYSSWELQTTTGFSSDQKTLSFGALTSQETYYATCELPRSHNGNVSHVNSLMIAEP